MINDVLIIPEKQLYENGDFRIYACSTSHPEIKLNAYNNCSIKGIMPKLKFGVEYISDLELIEIHEKFGASYKCISVYQDIPETKEGQKDYLSTIMTELQLNELYKVYSDEKYDIIELIKDKKLDYTKIRGIGESTFERIHQKLLDTIEYKEILSKFGKYSITYETILKLTEELGGSRQLAIQKLEENPYILTLVSGWGFKKADVIAQKMGIKFDDENRIRYGLKYTIEENQKKGHTYILKKDLLILACDILQLPVERIEEEVVKTEGLMISDGRIALQNTYNAEQYIADRLKEMLGNSSPLDFDPEEFVNRMESKYKVKLTDQQRSFFSMIKDNNVSLLIGFAGTGKTQMQKFLVELLDELNLRYTFLSPSAQAAKVSTSYTGVKATTIHRKIGWGKEKKGDMMYEIDEDFIIVDESGMMDIFIQNILLRKIINPKARILFVGDNFQLLSVAAGNFLHDAIQSKVLPMTMLDIVFRQQEGGLIDIATRIRLGEKFVSDDFSGKKLYGKDFVLHCVDQIHMEKGYKTYYDSYLNMYEPKDIMVLSSTNKGNLGTVLINKYVQSRVNPEGLSKQEHPFGDNITFRIGDYILNTQNMYDVCNYNDESIELVNGDKGILGDIVKDAESKFMQTKDKYKDKDEFEADKNKEANKNGIIVNYDGIGDVRMGFNEVVQLLHAWSISIHRSQGSASAAVLTVVDKSHKHQISANLLYTAITRAKQKGILLTQAETLNYAIRKKDNFRRNTFMQELLMRENDASITSP